MKNIPYLTAKEMAEVDRAMVADFRIELIQMMESAGRMLAALARDRFLDGNPVERSVLVLCGTGGNGGGGLVCARRLHAWGAMVRVITTRPMEAFLGIPDHQLDIVDRLGVPHHGVDEPHVLPDVDLVIDAIIGYGLEGEPRDEAAGLINLANEYGENVLSLDIPSGVDATTGKAHDPAVAATATLTLALPKTGLREAPDHVGELWLGDIGVPPELYRGSGLGYEVGPLFAESELLRLA